VPPIFGILNTRLRQTDPEMTGRMKAAAHYVKPRRIIESGKRGAFMAAAITIENPLVPGEDTMAVLGEWCIVADACLYRRREGGSDAGLILEAYLKLGEQCLKHLYGDFAFVIFNTETGEIFCGRDPLGVRPLFYTVQDGRFVFASELRLVRAAFEDKPPVRTGYLLDALITEKTEKDLTPYENMYRLPPGHFLLFQNGSPAVTRYWQPDTGAEIRLESEAAYVEMFRELLVDAVRMRCTGVSDLGSELSGGLDSSAVTGIAAESALEEGISLHTFSNIFPAGTGLEQKDEQEFIREMITFRALAWTGVDSLGAGIDKLLKHTLDVQGCFVQQNYNVFNHGLFQAASQKNIAVLLSGFGGDELVSARVAMPWNELISKGEWKVIRHELFYRGITLKSLLKPVLLGARYLRSRLVKPAYRTGVFTPELVRRRFKNLPLQPEFSAKHRLHERMSEKYRMPYLQRLSEKQLQRIDMDHLPQRMEYCYAAAAQFGIEYRYPLLDVNLVLAALAFPPWVKQHHGTNRYLFREAITGFVPEKIRQRDDKSGTTIPQSHYSLVTERELILDLVSSCSSSEFLIGIFDFSRFPGWYDRLVKRDPKDMNYLMPGAFYTYLMAMLYYRDEGRPPSLKLRRVKGTSKE
jgi:asparagine synthase (glutamine-hydrolysing)